VLADHWLPGMSGIKFRTRVRQMFPTAKRALLLAPDDRTITPLLPRAMALGKTGYFVAKPRQPRARCSMESSRTSSAVGEGSMAIQMVHRHLGEV